MERDGIVTLNNCHCETLKWKRYITLVTGLDSEATTQIAQKRITLGIDLNQLFHSQEERKEFHYYYFYNKR